MFLKECKEHFGTECLYELLGAEKTCSSPELKKAYYRQSMKWHPDKSTLKDESEETKELHTTRFQILNKAYSILSDSEKRKIYDETGCVDDEASGITEDSVAAWRKMFKKVTKEDIDNFMNEYEGSEEQEKDLISTYNKFDGNMDRLLEHALGFEDYDVLKDAVEQLIENGLVKSTKAYKNTTSQKKENNRRKKQKKEAEEAERVLKQMHAETGTSDLESMILARHSKRNANMDSFFDSLAEKYSAKKPKKK